jgi:Ca2+-binding EF-hand superfamily protein
LLNFLDKNNDGNVDMSEFLVGIRGTPNKRRQMIIDKAFLKFDKDCSGYIEPSDLKGVYDCSQHPKVRTGEMTEDQVYGEFLGSFGDTNHDFRVSRDVRSFLIVLFIY